MDGFEPHGTITGWDMPAWSMSVPASATGVYPGWGSWVGAGGVLYRYPARTVPGPIFSHILATKAYLRPNEGNSMRNDEVSEIGSRKGPRIPQN